jgi:peptide/nickel transport system substrate-binding protein
VSAGPYTLVHWTPRRSALLQRNPYYRGPRADTVEQIAFTMNVAATASVLQVRTGEADLGPIPPTAHAELFREFGLGTRYFVKPSLTIVYLALNNARPPFADVRARKAVNYAIDRPELVRQYGLLGGKRTDQIVPVGMPGYRDAQLYPIRGARPDRARALAPGLAGSKVVLVAGNRGSSPAVAQVVQYNLRQIGVDVEIRLLDPAVLPTYMGRRGSDWDVGVAGWSVDYADPFAFLGVLFDGRRIGPSNNTNLAYYDSASFNRRLDAAARLSGDARYAALAKLDADLMREDAPVAPYVVLNTRQFVSARVGCVRFVPLEGLSLAALCLR